MTPIFQVLADGNDISQDLSSRSLEIRVQDNAGLKNDRLTLTIDDGPDRQGRILELPPSKTKYTVLLGYEKAPNQEFVCPLTPVGVFIQDEITVLKNDRGRKLEIVGHAAYQEGTLKQKRTRSYHKTKLGDIVTECAERNGLEAVIDPKFGSIEVDHIDQTNESDGAFLTRLYSIYDAIAKPTRGKLYFGSEDSIRKMLGESSATVPIDEESCLEMRFTDKGQGKYTAVKSKYHDKDAGEAGEEESEATETHEEVFYTTQTTQPNKKNAKRVANSKKSAFNKREAGISFKVVGNPQLMAGGKVTLVDFRPGIPTEWQLSKVHHVFSDKGFTTECEGETKSNKPGNKGDGGSKEKTGGGSGSSNGSGETPVNDSSLPQQENSNDLLAPDLPPLGDEPIQDSIEESGDPATLLKPNG